MSGELLDVLVVGGGPVGACVGALLVRGAVRGGAAQALKVALLDPRPQSWPLPQAPLEPRVVAVSRASERVLKFADAWSRLPVRRLCPYERMRVWHESVPPRSSGALEFDAAEAAQPNLGHIVEARLLQAAGLEALVAAGGRILQAELARVQIDSDRVEVGTSSGTFAARLVIGADGAHSALRAAVGLGATVSGYGQTALVANVATERPHEQTAWQRFMRDGTLALLPLADGTSSIVWSADDPLAAALAGLAECEFAQRLAAASDQVLGSTRLVSERLTFPLRALAAERYVAERIALLGDAAHVVHPLAGQGMNLGILDAAALAELVLAARREREDPGAQRTLRAYERWRKTEVGVMRAAVDTFDRVLAHGDGPLARLAQQGLGLVNRSPELKRFFIDRALGLSGELPRCAVSDP